MSRSKLALVVSIAAAVAGCSGGSKTGPTNNPPSTYTVGGTVRAAPATTVDVDVANPAPTAHNDSYATAQQLPSVVTVGGWASFAPPAPFPTDTDDVYRVRLAAGQVVTLGIADPAACDLDLGLVFVATTTGFAQVSQGTGATESLTVATSDEYYVVVQAQGGTHTNYVLTLGRSAAAADAPDPAEALDATAEFVPGQVIVKFRDGPFAAAVETLDARAASVGLAARGGGPRRAMLMELPAGAPARAAALAMNGVAGPSTGPLGAPIVDDLERDRRDTVRLVKALRRRADVETADLNYVRRALAIPNDAYYPLQWHYPLMNLPQAWDVTDGTRSGAPGPVIAAVIDTGVLLTHPDLSAKIVQGYDFVSNPTQDRDLIPGRDPDATDPGTSPNPGQSSWHGTHVAGTIGAQTNNATGPNTGGVAGVSWGAKIMPIRVLGLNGSGTGFDIMQGVLYAAGIRNLDGSPANDSGTLPTQKADVINLSLGGPGRSDSEQAVYTQVRDAGVIVVAAAGNDNSSQLFYPASYQHVISVSAVDSQGNKAPYSNFGTEVDVAAPGGDTGAVLNGYPAGVLSTVGDDSSGTLQMAYWFMQGTSMASPHMTGVVALMRAVCPTLTTGQLETALASGTITYDLGATGRDDVYGHGFIDAFRAVQWASDPVHCASTTGTAAATITATPTAVDFAPAGATSATVTIAKIGSPTITVASVAVTGTPAWLTVAPPGGNGEGSYRLTPSTGGLADGVYAATLTFTATMSSGPQRTITVSVTLQKGAASATASAGHLYILLIDATDSNRGVGAEGGPTAGSYAFSFTGVPAGKYYLVAGSDSNNDGYICDAGESCGAYPTMSQPAEIDASTSPRSLNFQVGFTAALGGAAADAGGGLVVPPGGFKVPKLRKPAVTP